LFSAVDRETDDSDVTVTETLQVAAAARQTDEDVASREQLLHGVVGKMIYQFLAHTVDTQRGNLTDKLAAKNILSPDDKQKIKEQKKTDAKVKSLLLILRQKSGDQFESFLTALGETGRQSVADVVRQVLHVVGQTGHNPLQYTYGMSAHSVIPRHPLKFKNATANTTVRHKNKLKCLMYVCIIIIIKEIYIAPFRHAPKALCKKKVKC